MIIMRITLLILGFVGVCLAAIDLASITKDFKNVRVIRALDLTSSIVKESLGIRVKNTGTKGTDTYYFAIPAHDRPHLSFYGAVRLEEPKEPLEIEPLGLDTTKDVEVFKIHLNTTLEPESEMKIGLDLAYTHWIRPFPKKILQNARQQVTFTAGNTYLFSPYPSDDMKTTFVFPNSKILSFSGGEPNHVGQKTASKIVYGVFNDIQPLSFGASKFHYDFREVIPTITHLKRELQVSHWGGNMAVTEDYDLRHDGAELLHGYSAADTQQDEEVLRKTNMLPGLLFTLPRRAKDIYYSDKVGKCARFRIDRGENNTTLGIGFRYPLFGGWKVDWSIGYNAPLRLFLRHHKDEYILKFNFVENAKGLTFDNVEVKVILPEGATDIKVTLPSAFNMTGFEQTTHVTNFDTTGRPTIVLHKTNVVQAHEKPVLISYKYPLYREFQKPLAASSGFFIVFLLSILLSRIPFSLGEETEQENESTTEISNTEIEHTTEEKEEVNSGEEEEDLKEDKEDYDRIVESISIAEPHPYEKDQVLDENEIPSQNIESQLADPGFTTDTGKSSSIQTKPSANNRKKHER